MLMYDCLLHHLDNRLTGRCVSAVWTGIREIDGLALRTDFFNLSGLHTTVRAETAIEVSTTVFTDMQEYSRAAGGAMLYAVFNLSAAELTGFQFGLLSSVILNS